MAQQQAVPLALPAAPHGAGAGWRKAADTIDALPYIDTLTAEEKKQVEALIEEECRRSAKRPADFLTELPALPPSTLDGHPLLAAEYERVKAKRPMPPLDVSRYRLEPPPQTHRNDVSAWRACVDNAHAQLEHQYNRIHNLELLLKYGDKSWRAQVQSQESLMKQLDTQLSNTLKAVTALNQERKLSHTAAGAEMRRVQDEYHALVAKNLEIETACDALEEEIWALKTKLEPPQAAGTSPNGQPAVDQPVGQADGQADGRHAAGQSEGAGAMDVDESKGSDASTNGHV